MLGGLTFVQYQPMSQSSCWPLWPVVFIAMKMNRVPIQGLEYEVILSLSSDIPRVHTGQGHVGNHKHI